MTEVKCEGLLEGKTIKFGDIIIVGTKPAEKETEVQAS